MLTPADRIMMLDVLYDVRVAVAPDGRHLRVTGPSVAVHAAAPMLLQQRDALFAHLHPVAAGVGDTFGVSVASSLPTHIRTNVDFGFVTDCDTAPNTMTTIGQEIQNDTKKHGKSTAL